MKIAKSLLFAGAAALLTLWACDDTVEDNSFLHYDDAYYASYATISSSDAGYDTVDGGGTISFKYDGGTVDVFVHCDTDWTWENSNPNVFPAEKTGAYHLEITADENESEEELSGKITFITATDSISFATITITQGIYVAPAISIETTEWNVSAEGGTTEIKVEATTNWVATSTAAWITEELTDTSIILTAKANTYAYSRDGEVTLTCFDDKSSDSVTITVTQDAAE